MKDPFIYTIVQLASHEDCQHEDYKQGFVALDEEEKVVASCDLYQGIEVQRKTVRGTTPTCAIMKFRTWLNEGRDEDYLLSF